MSTTKHHSDGSAVDKARHLGRFFLKVENGREEADDGDEGEE